MIGQQLVQRRATDLGERGYLALGDAGRDRKRYELGDGGRLGSGLVPSLSAAPSVCGEMPLDLSLGHGPSVTYLTSSRKSGKLVYMNTRKTDYLAAAICRVLYDAGACDIDEIVAQLEDHYEGEATKADVLAELRALEAAESVEVINYEGTLTYQNADE